MAGSKKFIQAQRANIAASRRTMAQSRNMGYKALNNSLESIASNLTTSIGRNNAALMGSQGSQLAALRTLAARSKAKGSRITERTTDAITNRYGSAIAGGTDLSAMKATAKASGVVQKGIVGAAGLLAQGNEAAAATQSSGVAQAESAADYMASQAKLYRAKNDAGLIAEQQLELAKMRLQNKLDLENYRKKLKMDDEENKKTNLTSANAVGTFGAQGATTLLDIFNHVYVGSDGSFHDASEVEGIGTGAAHLKGDENVTMRQVGPAQAIQYYAGEYGFSDPNQQRMLTAVAQAMWGAGAGRAEGGFNRDPSVVSSAVTQQIALLYPDLKQKSLDNISGLISAQIAYTTGNGGAPPPEEDDGSGLTWGKVGTYGVLAVTSPGAAAGYAVDKVLIDNINGLGLSPQESQRIYNAVMAQRGNKP